MSVVAAPPCLCADSWEPLTDAMLDALWAHGVRAVGRYLDNLTTVEVARILARGFFLFFIKASRAPGWAPSAVTGDEDAAGALTKIAALTLPAGLTIFGDFETPAPASTPEDMMAHVDACAAPLVDAGHLSGFYVGAGRSLTSAQWQARPRVTRYAKSCSRLRDVAGEPVEPARGWCWVQGLPENFAIGPALVDVGLLLHDYEGGAVTGLLA